MLEAGVAGDRPREVAVLVVGGGINGAGILWEFALRGVPALLVEARDLAAGTSGRCHGLLHSGSRYAVSDPVTAARCARENAIIRRVAPHALLETGALQVLLEGDDARYVELWEPACAAAGIPVEEISPTLARRLEPRLSPQVRRAFRVPDAAVDPFVLVESLVYSAATRGATWLNHTRLEAVRLREGGVVGAELRDERTGERWEVACQAIVNAAGPWAAEVAALAGAEVAIEYHRGALLVLDHRVNRTVVNRLRPPGDGDLVVPEGPVTLLGTTEVPVAAPGDIRVGAAEVSQLLRLGGELLPGIEQMRVLRAFAGVRALVRNEVSAGEAPASGSPAAGVPRELSRSHQVVDHAAAGGPRGLISVLGGKLTTFRVVAEEVVDLVLTRPEAGDAPPAASREISVLAPPWRRRPGMEPLVCECEGVARRQVLDAARQGRAADLDDLRRRVRLGMGPCQGANCAYRAIAALQEAGALDWPGAVESFDAFRAERLAGQELVEWGSQAREMQVSKDLAGLLRGQVASPPGR